MNGRQKRCRCEQDLGAHAGLRDRAAPFHRPGVYLNQTAVAGAKLTIIRVTNMARMNHLQ